MYLNIHYNVWTFSSNLSANALWFAFDLVRTTDTLSPGYGLFKGCYLAKQNCTLALIQQMLLYWGEKISRVIENDLQFNKLNMEFVLDCMGIGNGSKISISVFWQACKSSQVKLICIVCLRYILYQSSFSENHDVSYCLKYLNIFMPYTL